jgi:FkbM family methyltransferase
MDRPQSAPIGQAPNGFAHPHARASFAQFGEDIVALSILEALGRGGGPGFYVDVGACDPVAGSNTHLLHLRGWSGVNIDANPASIERFREARPHDRNVQAAVSDREEDVEFEIYALAALSTADAGAKADYAREGRAQIVETLFLRTYTLRAILDQNVPPGQAIDLMSVDVEGLDLAVLRSNDWARFAPEVLLVEDLRMSLSRPLDSAIFGFLAPLGYRLASHVFITSIYVRDRPPG